MQKGKEALIALNIARERPGTFLDVLQDRGWKPTIVNLEAGEIFPSPRKFGALIVMGGPPSANDGVEKTRWMPKEISEIREALDAEVPYLGVCLGLQTLVKAAGGEVLKSPRRAPLRANCEDVKAIEDRRTKYNFKGFCQFSTNRI